MYTLKGSDVVLDAKELPEDKPALHEKYLWGDLPQNAMDVSTITPRTSGSAAPLSFGQQEVWFLAQLMPDTPVYNKCVTVRMPGSLDVDALEQSLNELLRRHEAWRTSFPTVDGQPMQMIHPALLLKLPVVDLRYLPETEREVEALQLATEEAGHLFDLAHGPLLRATLIRLGDGEHRLFLTLHRIICDDVTIYQVFLPELHALYEAFSTGQPSPLPELPIQYADFAVWQRELLQGDVFASQLAYWKQHLVGAPMALELPTDRLRPPIPTYRGSMHQFELSKHLTDALRTLSSQEGVCLYITLVAAFKTLLHRYTGQDDLLTGTTTTGRKYSEIQELMGFFLNTLVLRTDMSGNPTFRELLGRVREVTLEAHANEDVPFEYLVKELQRKRELGLQPFFQVLLTLEPPLPTLPSGWTLTQMDVQTDTSQFDLSLILQDRSEGLIGRFEYSTDLFDAASIERMVGHWQTLLKGIVAAPEQRLMQLPLLTEAERQQLLVEWNATQTSYPKERCVYQLFEDQVERTPDAVALVFERQRLTYRELNAQANQLAHHLRQMGVGPEVRVGLCMERSLEMLVSLLGIFKAGGVYVPLDPTYPSERLTFMLRDAEVAVLLTKTPLLSLLAEQTSAVLCLDTEWPAIADARTDNPVREVQGDHLAYLIYTSGSTGRPKGVAVTHHNLWHSTQARLSYYHEPVTRFLLLFSIAFDTSLAAIFWTLCQGGTLLLPKETVLQDPFQLTTLIEQQQPSHLMSVTSLYTSLLELAEPQQLGALRAVIVGGERCPRELVEHHWKRLPHCALFNEYGPTEATVWSTVYRCEVQERRGSIPIGRPIANMQVYVLNESLQPMPIGAMGELYVGGAGVARGYLNQPELTAERFVPNPFSKEPGGRLYKTGDLVRYLPDGNIEFLGRIDHQVKIHGFRIELGEIENVLRQHPGVRETVVVAGEDTPGDKRLVAYVVLSKEQSATVGDLQRHVMKQLPTYMIPSAFVLLEALPLTPNGKLDRRALPASDLTRGITEEPFVAPTLMVHYQLRAIWEELLGARPIGIRDNFFDVGGHSLLATRLVDRIKQVFRKKLPLSTLFTAPTIEQLADVLLREEDIDTNSRAPLVAVQLGKSKRPFFFFNGDGYGGAFYCFNLARDLGTDQPFYVLEPHRYQFDDLQALPSFEAMVAAHIEPLRTVQPEGPYLLGGFCGGGLVAFELARQLHAAGQAVDLLALIEPGVASTRLRLSRSFISRIANLLRLSPDKQLDCFLYLRHLAKFLLYSSYRNLPHVSLFPTTEALRQDGSNILAWVAAPYIPREYPGKVTFLWASEGPYRRVEWLKVAKEEGEVQPLLFGVYHTLLDSLIFLLPLPSPIPQKA